MIAGTFWKILPYLLKCGVEVLSCVGEGDLSFKFSWFPLLIQSFSSFKAFSTVFSTYLTFGKISKSY